jgi:hypothetical protein
MRWRVLSRSTVRAQSFGIVLLSTLLSSSGYFPTAKKIESQPRSATTKHPAAAATGVRPNTNPSDSSGDKRSES